MIICFIKGKESELNDVIAELSNEKGFCELESPAETKFIAFPSGESYESFTRGFIFNKDFELKWMKIDDRFHIVYTGKEEKLPQGNWQGKRKLEKTGSEYVYLWTNKERVNKDLSYPVEGEKVKILVETLKGIDEQSNFYVKRFSGLEGEK